MVSPGELYVFLELQLCAFVDQYASGFVILSDGRFVCAVSLVSKVIVCSLGDMVSSFVYVALGFFGQTKF